MNPFQLPKPLYSLQEIIVSQKYNLAFKQHRQDQQRQIEHQQRQNQKQQRLLQAKQRIKQKKTVYLQYIQQNESPQPQIQVEMNGPPKSLLSLPPPHPKFEMKHGDEISDHSYNDDGTCFYKFNSSNQWVNEYEIKSYLVIKEYNDTIGSDLYTNIIHQVYNLHDKESWRQLIIPSQKGSLESFLYSGLMNHLKKNFLSSGNHLKLKSGLHIKFDYINDFKMYLKKFYPTVSIGRYGREINI
jgi:hypothetical protein